MASAYEGPRSLSVQGTLPTSPGPVHEPRSPASQERKLGLAEGKQRPVQGPTQTPDPAASPLTSKQVKVIWVQELEAEKGEDHFYREGTAVHEVAIKYLHC